MHCLPTSDSGISTRPDLQGPVKALLGRSDGSSRSLVKGGHHADDGESMGECLGLLSQSVAFVVHEE